MPCALGCSCNWQPVPSERLVAFQLLLRHSDTYRDQTAGRGAITGLTHALRVAALAEQNASWPEASFVGLVHDLARPLNDVHHGEVVAEMVRDRVSEQSYWMLRTHGQYQAALVHDKPDWPAAPKSGWRRHAIQLAGMEAASFTVGYRGPTLTLEQADRLLAAFLA